MRKLLTTILSLGVAIALLPGCISSSKNQRIEFQKCEFHINDATGLEEPKYPRSIQIGVNDQMVEQGDETSGGRGNPFTTAFNWTAEQFAALKDLFGLFGSGKPPATPDDTATAACQTDDTEE